VEDARVSYVSDGGGRHGVPALLSLFLPGLGQIVKGDILRAFLVWGLFLADIAGFSVFFVLTGWPAALCLGLAGAAIIWLWNVYDAYNR
jgi:hypothetical protein